MKLQLSSGCCARPSGRSCTGGGGGDRGSHITGPMTLLPPFFPPIRSLFPLVLSHLFIPLLRARWWFLKMIIFLLIYYHSVHNMYTTETAENKIYIILHSRNIINAPAATRVRILYYYYYISISRNRRKSPDRHNRNNKNKIYTSIYIYIYKYYNV